MPSVLCGLHCFDVPSLSTAGSVARELTASLDPALEGAGCAVEVYRLQPLAHDAPLAADETVLCRLPSWHFDLGALEGLLGELEELRLEHKTLQVQHGRVREALLALNASVEAGEVSAAPAGAAPAAPEVQSLRRQLAQSARTQQETKQSVLALRSEFMHLLDVWGAGDPAPGRECERRAAALGPGPAPGGGGGGGARAAERERERDPRGARGPCAAAAQSARRRRASPQGPWRPAATPRPGSRSQGARPKGAAPGAAPRLAA